MNDITEHSCCMSGLRGINLDRTKSLDNTKERCMDFRRQSKKRMGQDLGLSVWRDAYVGFHRRNVRDGKVEKMLEKMDEGESEGASGLGNSGGGEMNHSRRVELSAYARINMEF